MFFQRFIQVNLVAMLVSVAACSLAQENHPIVLERDVAVKMRDSLELKADVYRPQEPGKYPVLLQRTPYNKGNQADLAIHMASRGYVVIVQDVRGRFASPGEWYPFKNESQDGYDTVEWAARLAYSDGRVGMFGESYVGATQMLAAIAHPPHLAGIAPSDTPSNYHDGWTYQSGAFQQGFNESWTRILTIDTISKFLPQAADFEHDSRTLPLSNYPLYHPGSIPPPKEWTAKFAPYFLDWLAHPGFDDYWSRWSIEDHYSDIQVPALTITAWYDIFQGGALRNYMGMKAHAGNEAARKGQRLIIAIGGHAGSGRKIGEIDFGPATASYSEDDSVLTWYDHLFKGIQNQWATGKPVRIFVMGQNVWREEDDWPLPNAKSTAYYLHSAGHANSLSGNGKLSLEAPQSEPADSFLYDPLDPVPTIGGPLCCESSYFSGGPMDQRPAEKRQDVLIYNTGPFSKDTEVIGPVGVDLYATSSAVDTDFTAKLVDVWPNGYAQNLTEGILRARYRDSQATPSPLVPGKVYKLHLDLWSTGNVFKKGHILRLEISSSNFPRFDRNLNTGKDQAQSDQSLKATNTVLHDREHPSVLFLPIASF